MIWAISDLHLSLGSDKPMDVFGDRWKDHASRIATSWRQRVAPDSIVLVAGDISWALRPDQALPDLQWIDALPGRKVLTRGNHDYWWSSSRIRRVRKLLPASIAIIEGEALDLGPAVVCGTRGWITPETPGFQESRDRPFFEREQERLARALDAATALAAQARPIIVMIHFPPFVDRQPTAFARMIAGARAAACIYGHLHQPRDWGQAVQGSVDGVFYQLTSCDYLGFGPVAVRGLD